MPDKRVRIVKKGTFEGNIEGDSSLVDKKYVDEAHPEADCFTYEETMEILNGNGG